MSKIIFPLLLLFAAFSGVASAQQIPAAITTDPAPDKDFPAATESPDILSHGTRLNAVFFIASGRGPHPVVLLLHGFPGNEKNLDIAYTLRRAGWDVLFPHYRGAWGSAGSFSLFQLHRRHASRHRFSARPREREEISHGFPPHRANRAQHGRFHGRERSRGRSRHHGPLHAALEGLNPECRPEQASS
jgi:pimeloyl-ACP methyl ester carboxylesterase